MDAGMTLIPLLAVQLLAVQLLGQLPSQPPGGTRLGRNQIGCRLGTGSGTCIRLGQAAALSSRQLPKGCSAEWTTVYFCSEPLSRTACTPSGRTVQVPIMTCVLTFQHIENRSK